MARSQNEGIMAAPVFTPHRVNVATADAAPPSATHKFAHGIDTTGYQEILAQVKLVGTNVTVEALYWSDLDGAYVPANPVEATAALTASAAVRFKTAGRRVFLRCTGTFTRVDIDVAGAPPTPESFA